MHLYLKILTKNEFQNILIYIYTHMYNVCICMTHMYDSINIHPFQGLLKTSKGLNNSNDHKSLSKTKWKPGIIKVEINYFMNLFIFFMFVRVLETNQQID